MPRMKLVENFTLSPNDYHKREVINEEDQTLLIREKSGEETKYKAKAIFTFPISRPDAENLNGRVYEKKLWDNVIKNKMGENSYGLMDHPDDEGSTKDRWCVWRNIRYSEDKKLVLADAYLFGSWGQEVLEGLEAGGKVGLSTSGYGELQEDNKTVNPDSYELERVADFVFNPSYEVFGTKEDVVSIEDKKEESVEDPEKEVLIEEDKNLPIIEKDKKEMEKNNKLMEKSFIVSMKSFFKENQAIESLDERIKAYNELLSYFEEGVAVDLRSEIQEALDKDLALKEEYAKKGEKAQEIEESSNTLKEELKNLKEEIFVLTEEKDALAEKLNGAFELLDSTKTYTNKLQEMYELIKAEKNGMVSASDYSETLSYLEDVEKEKESLDSENIKLIKKVSILEKRLALYREKAHEFSKKDEDPVEEALEEIDEEVEKELDTENVSREVLRYYHNLEVSNPNVVTIKEEILRSKTLMEAQLTFMKLQGLVEKNSNYDRKVVREKNVFAESNNQELNIRKGWM